MSRNLSADQLDEIAGGAAMMPGPIVTPPICELPVKWPPHSHDIDPVYPTLPIDPYIDIV